MAQDNINDLFSNVAGEGQRADEAIDPFSLVALEPPPPATARNVTTQMVALTNDPSASILGVQEHSIDTARQLLDQGGEYAYRNKMALDRATRQMTILENQRKSLMDNPVNYNQKAIDEINRQYSILSQQQFEDSQRTALELETVERIHDLSTRDPTQAQVMYDLYKNGNAQKVMSDYMAKSLIMSQRMEEMQADYGDHNWGNDLLSGIVNLSNPALQIASFFTDKLGPNPAEFALEYLTPTRGNFARAGILNDAKIPGSEGGLMNWLFSGSGLQDQSNTLWALPLDKFAAAMDRNGPVMQSIRDNATLLGQYSEVTAMDVLRSLNYQTDSDRAWANAWGVADPLLILPVGKVLSVPKLMLRAGARREAADLVSKAVESMAKEGAEGAVTSAATKADDVIESIEMTAFNPKASNPTSVPLAQDVMTQKAATDAFTEQMNDVIQRSGRFNTDEELQAAYQSGTDELRQQFGKQVADVKPMYETTLTGAKAPFTGVTPEQGGVLHFWDVTFGKKTGGGWAAESSARRNALGSGRTDAEVFRSTDGQWYYRSRFNMKETQFYTEELATPAQSGPLKWMRSTARRVSPREHGKVLADESSASAVAKKIKKEVADLRKGLTTSEDTYLYEILKKGQQDSRWFNESEFESIYERATGSKPSAKVKHAYNSYQVLNNFDFNWRNSLVYEQRALQGAESVQFRLGSGGDLVNRDAIVVEDPRLRPRGDVFDASTGSYIPDVTASKIQEYADNGYALVKLMDNINLPDKTQIKYAMVKKSDLARGPLRREQLGYSAGGHRAYTGHVWAKQTAVDGRNRLVNPNVLLTGSNPNNMAEWAERMNAAIKAVRDGSADAAAKPSVTYTAANINKQIASSTSDAVEATIRAEIQTAIDEGADVYILSKGKRNSIAAGRDFRVGDITTGKTLKFDYKNTGVKDPAWLDTNIFRGDPGYPTGDEFLRMIDNGDINTKFDIVVTQNREMPKEYVLGKGHPDLELVDDFDAPEVGYYRTTGQMYYSGKGKPMKDYTGNLAETVDPWQSLNSGLANLSRTSTLSNYRAATIERFRNTWGQYLDLPDLSRATGWDLAQAPIKSGIKDRNPMMRQAIAQTQAEQEAMRRVLSFETDFDRHVRNFGESVRDWVLGDSKGVIKTNPDGTVIYERSGREKIANWVDAAAERRPVEYLRGWAFDLKLGMFNPSQLLVQSGTMFSAMLLHPLQGVKGAMGAVPLLGYARAGAGKEAVLEQLVKNGAWKIASFENPEEFKEFARFMNKSGMLDIGNHLAINDIGSNALMSANTKLSNFREAGRLFFYVPEQLNRLTAARIGWEQLKEAGVPRGSAKFREEMARLTDDYSFNMMNASSATFQRGGLSIPTQFWGYNFRMMDALMGGRFTLRQKLRLGVGQFMLFGAAGVPFIDTAADMIMKSNPDLARGFAAPSDDERISTAERLTANVQRGLLDAFIFNTSGADVAAGEKFGTGGFLTNLIKDVYGISEYGPKSAAEILTGPTGSVAWSASESLINAVKWAVAESGGDGYPATKESVLRLANEISTWSNASKAIMVMNYGGYKTNKGAVVSDLPTETAFFLAVGFQPGQANTDGYIQAYLKNKQEMITDASRQIRNWRQEAALNPDMTEENMKKVNMLVQMLPADIRDQTIRKSRSDDTFHEFVARKYEEEVQREEFTRAMNDEGNNQ